MLSRNQAAGKSATDSKQLSNESFSNKGGAKHLPSFFNPPLQVNGFADTWQE